MKKSKFTEEQIAYALRQVESGTPPADVCRQLGSAKPPSTSGRRSTPIWASASCGKLRSLEDENGRAEAARGRPHARQAHAPGGVEKKGLRPARRRELAAWFQATYSVSVQRACHLAQFSRAAWYRRSAARDQCPLRLRIRELAHARPRFGFLRIWVLLRREGWMVNRKRVRRLYRLEGLQLRMRVRRRKHIALHRGPAPVPSGPTERWSMDFVHDALADGRPFRILTVVDQWSRQSPLLRWPPVCPDKTLRCARPRPLDGTAPCSDHRRSRHRVHVAGVVSHFGSRADVDCGGVSVSDHVGDTMRLVAA